MSDFTSRAGTTVERTLGVVARNSRIGGTGFVRKVTFIYICYTCWVVCWSLPSTLTDALVSRLASQNTSTKQQPEVKVLEIQPWVGTMLKTCQLPVQVWPGQHRYTSRAHKGLVLNSDNHHNAQYTKCWTTLENRCNCPEENTVIHVKPNMMVERNNMYVPPSPHSSSILYTSVQCPQCLYLVRLSLKHTWMTLGCWHRWPHFGNLEVFQNTADTHPHLLHSWDPGTKAANNDQP